MKFMILKKFVQSLLLLALISPFFAFAEHKKEGVLNTDNTGELIDFINNDDGTLSVGDIAYRLKLNTKVYDAQRKLVNRYALREGQRVLIEIADDATERYLDSIYILKK